MNYASLLFYTDIWLISYRFSTSYEDASLLNKNNDVSTNHFIQFYFICYYGNIRVAMKFDNV